MLVLEQSNVLLIKATFAYHWLSIITFDQNITLLSSFLTVIMVLFYQLASTGFSAFSSNHSVEVQCLFVKMQQ